MSATQDVDLDNKNLNSQNASGSLLRKKYRGLIGIKPKLPIADTRTLSLVYTPGVAKPCLEIARDYATSFDYTIRANTVAIVSDGSSVYGLKNAGPEAVIPMLEAKSVFHKNFAGIDGFPIALDLSADQNDVDWFVETVRYLSPTFGGFHLEGISSPRCFAIEERLKRAVSLPIFHADQHGPAVAVLAALKNALKIVNKKMSDIYVVINGAGAGGIATARLLKYVGVGNVKVLDRHGSIYYRRTEGLNWVKSELARQINPEDKKGDLKTMIDGADVFIGFSAHNTLTPEMVKTMAKDPIVFSLALPLPEMSYEAAKQAGAKVVATSLSDAPNQINSSLAFPGIFRGALDVHACDINQQMLLAAADAMASMVEDAQLGQEVILPSPLEYRTAAKIARAVAQAAIDSGVAKKPVSSESIEEKVMRFVYEGSNAWVEPETKTAYESNDEEALELHRRYHGVLETTTHIPIRDAYIYKEVYSQPNAAIPCQEIMDNPELVHDLTVKNNLVAVVTDGSAVLGLGNIGPAAGLPVMEGKAVLFKTFGGVEAFPICLRTQEVDEIVAAVKRIAPVFGGINLEDIAAPRCFEVEKRLINELEIPVFHDDQHGTAVVVLAGMINALKIVGKKMSDVRLVVNGAGASALSVSRLLMHAGIKDVAICDTKGVIYKGRTVGMNPFKEEIAEMTNLSGATGLLADVIKGADIVLGLSAPGQITQDMVRSMAKDPIVFALANPVPEIMPDEAYEAGVKVMATGRSDFPNQVNNSLAFPGIFRGALDVKARVINEEMKMAAAYAIADLIDQDQLGEGIIIPAAFDFRVPPAVAAAVAKAACETSHNGKPVARRPMKPEEVSGQLENYIKDGVLTSV
ncbi:MAG: malic enzyme-like NAD(P)-binding protein [Vampirovibrionales bacterium]|nr:malic enzyme-like NAD(P)-binding protein [Vampirovibrionales bacterium]